MSNSNFPENLDIHPLVASETNEAFGFNAQKEAIIKYGIAGRVWEAAYLMNDYINDAKYSIFDPPFFKEDRNIVMELGSGSGLVASNLVPALRPERDLLILTDLPEVCPLLEENLRDLSRELPVHVFPLAWGNITQALFIHSQILPSQTLTHIICSDLVYFPELLAPLLRTLIQLTAPPFATTIDAPIVFISYRVRSLSKETPFWSAFGLWFTFQPVLVREVDQLHAWQRFGASLEDLTFVFAAHRRPGSFDWNVPERDGDLLAGVGANGSSHRKSDDSFETLLIMTRVIHRYSAIYDHVLEYVLDMDHFPEELVLIIISYLNLQGLIKARGVSKHWRALIEDPLTQVSLSRRRLLELYLKVVHSPSFTQTREFNLHDLQPHFNRKEYLDDLLAAYRHAVSNSALQLSDLPEEFVLWILEYPSQAIFGRFWPGLPQIYRFTHAKPQLYGAHSLSALKIHQLPGGGLTSTDSEYIPCLSVWAERDGDAEDRWMTLCAAKEAHPDGLFEKAGTLCKRYYGKVFAVWGVDDWIDGLDFIRAAAGGRAVI